MQRLSARQITLTMVVWLLIFSSALGDARGQTLSGSTHSEVPGIDVPTLVSRDFGIFHEKLPGVVTLAFTVAAFLATFYALLRNNPSLRPEAGSVFYAIALALLSGVCFLCAACCHPQAPGISASLVVTGSVTFLGTVLLLIRVFWRSHVRMNYMHEGRGSRKFFVLNRWWRSMRPGRKTYEFEAVDRQSWSRGESGLLSNVADDLFERLKTGGSLLILGKDMMSLRNGLLRFVGERLTAGDTVDYVTCADAPFRILTMLLDLYPGLSVDNLTFIDAFSCAFGFKDDIVGESQVRVKEQGVATFSATTCAGLHRALKEAFNHTKAKQLAKKRNVRLPALMVYDSCSALALLDSEEQVRVFAHHMLPAERSYKMLTFMIEHVDMAASVRDTIKGLVDGTVMFGMTSGDATVPQAHDTRETFNSCRDL